MDYPEFLLRGIYNKTFLDEEGLPAQHLFYFDEKGPLNSNGFWENSINWLDDDLSLKILLDQKKPDGSVYQFESGVASIPRKEIDRLRTVEQVSELLMYERQPLPNNKYHGNLLLHSSIKKSRMRRIAAVIAIHAKFIPREKDEENTVLLKESGAAFTG